MANGSQTKKKRSKKLQEAEKQSPPTHLMRRFQIVRKKDPNNMSGTGVVGEGCQFTSGECAYRFVNTDFHMKNWAPNVHAVEALHSHLFQEPTYVRWIDPKPVKPGDEDADQEADD